MTRNHSHFTVVTRRRGGAQQERTETMEVSVYEQSREERIKENLERMQKLGIHDLSLKFKSLKPTPNRPSFRKTPQSHTTLPTPSGPVRRSSRLQNSTPVSYSEVHLTKKDNSLNDDDQIVREVGSKPEVYDEEHEKLLGSTETSWTLFVDGYGKDGKRIYDPVRGKTCHQCRQKTLGHRTHCSNCNMVQGQFCGDCLYMRYGENVLEANKNPNWICPVCRGICNCSLCRQAKGWPPTGTMYRKISSLGYKSVAHYLVQTRRANKDSDKDTAESKTPVSAKRSLPFSDNEVALEHDNDLSKSNGEHLKFDDPLPEPEKDGFSRENEKELNCLVDKNESSKVSETLESGNDEEIKKDEIFVGLETNSKLTEKSGVIVSTTPDSIGGRLRKRGNHKNEEVGSINGDYCSEDAEDVKTPDIIAGSLKQKSKNGKRNAKDISLTADMDSIARRLKMRRRV